MCDIRTGSLLAVANLPRLPPAAEHRLVKFVCGLPPRLQRLLFGAPPVIDGQTLAMDIHALLWLDRLVYDDESLAGGKGVEETRAERLKEARIVAHRPPIPMARVEELELPGLAGPIRARLFTPPGAEEPAPLLVYFHGGGWVIGDLDTHDDPCRFLAANAGARVLSVDYRLAPEHPFPAGLDDAEEGAAYAARLEDAGVPVEYVPGPGLIHGFAAFLGVVDAAEANLDQILASLGRLMRGQARLADGQSP